jgi:hypothetical protein
MAGEDPVTQIEEGRLLEADLGKEDPRVFVTSPDEPDEGRTFVWTEVGWFERMEEAQGEGPVAFSPLSMDEDELRGWLSEQGLEITELDDEFSRNVRDEFLSENPLYMEAPELSNQEYEG